MSPTRRHYWYIVLAFLVVTAYSYLDLVEFFWPGAPAFLTATSHLTVGLPFYLLVVAYTSYIFGPRAGCLASAGAFLVILPMAVLAQSFEAVAGSIMVAAAGAGISFWMNPRRGHDHQVESLSSRVSELEGKLNEQMNVNAEQQRSLATFTAFSAMLSQSLEVSQVMQTGIHMVMEVMRAPVVVIYSLDQDSGDLRLVAFEGISRESATGMDHIKIGEGINGRVAENGHPLVVPDVLESSQATREVIRSEGLRSILCVPLVARGKITGTLAVGSRTSREFQAADVDQLVAVANHIGIAMENSRLYQRQIDVVEQLKVSEERYRQLFEDAHDAIWVQELSGKNIAANDAAAKLIGYSFGHEIVGKDVRDFIPSESRALAREVRDKLLRGEAVEQPYEQKLVRKDGTIASLKLTTSLITSDGQPAAFQHIARDITTERRLQENLRFYVQQITQAQEEESKRIARELHDSTAQTLIATLHQLENFCHDNPDACSRENRFLPGLREQLKLVLQEIRQFSRDLRPSILDDLGLLPAVEWLVEELKRGKKVEATLSVNGVERRFAPEVEVALFRIIQEALRNITKHAQASHAEVSLDFRDKETIVTISDNGLGFELPRMLTELPRIGKLGLVGMQERARLIGGALDIESAPGKGTTLRITLPVEAM